MRKRNDSVKLMRFGFARGRGCALYFGAIVIGLTGALTGLAATYQVGPSQNYHQVSALPALKPGDHVEIDPGTYNEVKRWTDSGTAANPIIIRGTGNARPVFDATGKTVDGALPHPRAVFQVEGNYITLENLEFKNARNGDNGAGIRVTSANNVTVRNCKISMCDMGIMCDNNSNLLIESSEIASNGTAQYDGYSHNFYLGGNNSTVRFCYIHDALNGQNFKSRGHYTELLYNYIADSQDGEVGLVDSTATAAPNSHAVMIGNVVVSKPRSSGYNSGRFIQFGQDMGGQHNGRLFAFNNTFVAGDGRIQFLSTNAGGASVVAANNIFYGSDKIVGTLGAGISGSNNWMQSSAAIPATFFATVTGTDPGFVNRAARDWHLTAGSVCRDHGLNALTFIDGQGNSQSGVPSFQYLSPLQGQPRPADKRLDIGAYEYGRSVALELRIEGSDCVIGFTTASGSSYEVDRSDDLSSGAWVPFATNLAGTDGTIQVTDPQGGTLRDRFYRVRPSM